MIETKFDEKAIQGFLKSLKKMDIIMSVAGMLTGLIVPIYALLEKDRMDLAPIVIGITVPGALLLIYISILGRNKLYSFLNLKKNISYTIDKDHIIENSTKGEKKIERSKTKKIHKNPINGVILVVGENKEKIMIMSGVEKYDEILKELGLG